MTEERGGDERDSGEERVRQRWVTEERRVGRDRKRGGEMRQ